LDRECLNKNAETTANAQSQGEAPSKKILRIKKHHKDKRSSKKIFLRPEILDKKSPIDGYNLRFDYHR
jgi:hypothetical protein